MYCYSYVTPKMRPRHMVFALFLLSVLVGSFLMACLSSGPVILGTELNANGHLEYLCLGNGCENFSDFRWKD